MAEDIISGYLSREGFASDTKYGIEQIALLLAQFEKLKEARSGLQSSAGAKEISGSVSQATNAIKETTAALAAQTTTINQNTIATVKQNLSLEQNIKNLNDYKAALSANNAIQKQARKDVESGAIGADEYRQKITKLTEAQFKLKQQVADSSKEIKLQTLLNSATPGSIASAKVQNTQLTRQRDALPASNIGAITQLNALIDRNNQLIDANSDKLAKQKINIGNYSGAVSILKESFTEVIAKMDGLTKAGKADTEVFAQLEKEYQLLNKLVDSQEAGFANATMEIRANQRALLELENAGLAGTESFKKLEQATGDLQDQFSDLKARTKQLGSDTFVFDGLISAAQGLAGAYGAAQGVAALFGAENEDLQKTMVKLQAVMTIVQSLQSLQNALQAESAGILLLQSVRTKALAIAQGVYAVAVGTSTGTMKLFRIALLATGIGAIIGLLVLAADAMGAFGSSTAATTEDLQKQAEAIQKNKEALKDIADAAEKSRDRTKGGLNDLKRELELATARGDSEEKLQKLKNEISAKEISNLAVQFYTFKGYQDKQLDILEDAKNVKNKNNAEILEFEKKQLEAADKIRKENAEKEKKRREKALEDAKKFSQEELKATFGIFRDNAEERARQDENLYNDEKGSLDQRLKALVDFNTAKQSIINAQRDFDLIGIRKGSKQEEQITRKAIIDQNKLLEEVSNKKIEIIKNNNDNELAASKELTEGKVKLLEDESNAIRDTGEKDYNDSIKGLNSRFARGLISQKDYNEKRAKIEIGFQIESLQREIDYQQKLVQISDLPLEQKAEALRKLSDLEKQLSDATKDHVAKNEGEKRDDLLKTLEDIKNYSSEIFSLIDGLLNAGLIAQKNKLKAQSDEYETAAARQIELINASADSEEKKAARVTVVNARLAAQKEQIAIKERQAEIKRAQFEKATAIFNIILDTASAVIKSLPEGLLTGVTYAIGALGAAQLAVAVATPVPKFKHGKDANNKYQGWGIVDDGGRNEPIYRAATGNIEMSTGTPKDRLTFLNKDDIVFPELMQVMLKTSMPAIKSFNDSGKEHSFERMLDRQTKELKPLLQRIADKRENHITAKDGALVSIWKHGASMTKYIQESTNW